MPQFVEAILPSGRAVRVRHVSLREKLEIDRRVSERKGDSNAMILECVCTALQGYTRDPVKLVSRVVPLAAPKGRSKAAPASDPADAFDVEATFAGIGPAWVSVGYEDLRDDGGEHCILELFSLPDFRALTALVDRVMAGQEEAASPLAGKTRGRFAGS